MTPVMHDMTFTARIEQFAAVLQRCRVSAGAGVPFELEAGLLAVKHVLAEARAHRAAVYIIGNGGSAAIASHAVNDLINGAKLRAATIHDPSLLTCMSNDYGYENAYAKILAQLALRGDVLIAISSSGRSMNIRNAAAQVRAGGGTVITLSGFAHDNPLRVLGDLNIWLDSSDYGVVEVGHQFVLHNLSDRLCDAAREPAP